MSVHDNDYDEGYISMNALECIWDKKYVHPYINARDYILKIHEHIKKTQIEWKVSELSAKRMVKGSHKVFKSVVKWFNNSFPFLGESGS